MLCCDEYHTLLLLLRLCIHAPPPCCFAAAMYMFVSGYTAKIAGTEVGVKEPEATFSACFGAAFLMW